MLDNFEHLVKAVLLLSDLLVAAPQVKLLVTATKALGYKKPGFIRWQG